MVDSLLKPPSRGSVRARRLARTILLGALAIAIGVYWVADSFGVDRDELLGYLGASALFVLAFTAAGVLAGLCLWAVRRARR